MTDNNNQEKNESMNAAWAAFWTALLSIIVTIAGSMLSLKLGTSQRELFYILFWLLATTTAVGVVFALWLVLDGLRSEIHRLQAVRRLESFTPLLIRFRRRSDHFSVGPTGDCGLTIECEVEVAPGATVPWIAIPMWSEVLESRGAWSSIQIEKILVDGTTVDAGVAFVRRDRRTVVDDEYLKGRVVEGGAIRVPVSLGPNKKTCNFSVDLKLLGAFVEIQKEEMCYTDVSYVTEELLVTIEGVDGLKLSGSPFVAHRVEALQLGMELLDVPESQLQSLTCQFGSRVQWRSNNAKLGYRYRIPIRAVSSP